MKIYDSDTIQKWDEYTIENEPISSLDLMERAAVRCTARLKKSIPDDKLPIHIFCGSGNNGGDGLVIGRLLFEEGYAVTIVLCKLGDYSKDNKANQDRLPSGISVKELKDGSDFVMPTQPGIAIDAIFGVGLNRPVEGSWASLLAKINQFPSIYAVDIPSGLFSEPRHVKLAVKAHRTFTFQIPKLSFFFPEFEDYVGNWEVIDIGLLAGFQAENGGYNYQILEEMRSTVRQRPTFSHKGTFGHALLFAGSLGKIGAAILSAEACLRSGVGLLSIHAPKCAYSILQTRIPEAMVQSDINEHYIAQIPEDLSPYQAIGIGPGLDKREKTKQLMPRLFSNTKVPIVIDADGLNIISENLKLLEMLPKSTVLTPHPGEFDRLFGAHDKSWERLETARTKAKELGVNIILKGAYSSILNKDGDITFNSSGNSGLATGGTGDALTGIILSLLAQDYHPYEACKLAVFLHGLSADLAMEKESCESMIASDIIRNLGKAFKKIENC